MNPLRIARVVRDDYLALLRTTFSPRQQELREAFNREIERDGFLTREPFVSLAQAYRIAAPLQQLAPEVRTRFGPIAESPFEHQAIAAHRIAAGEPTVVATGTGSGKTEAFLIPIVDYCYLNRAEPGVKAILVYPMNALATDQLRRVRVLLAGSGVTFGRYTGETELSGQRPGDVPLEERVTRVEFRQNPPHIFLTNYQMLEYMLLRGDGRDIFVITVSASSCSTRVRYDPRRAGRRRGMFAAPAECFTGRHKPRGGNPDSHRDFSHSAVGSDRRRPARGHRARSSHV